MNSELSIVIVEYLSVDEICCCVDRIFSKLSLPFEIIVSSNSCYSQAEQEKVQTSEPRVKWLFNEQNGGFAYAMNKGLKASRGEYVVIMNSDSMDALRVGLPILAHKMSTRGYEAIQADGYLFSYSTPGEFAEALQKITAIHGSHARVVESFNSHFSFQAGRRRFEEMIRLIQ